MRLSPCTQNSAFHFARAHSSSSFSLSYLTHKFSFQRPAFCKVWGILPQFSSAIDFPSQLTLKRQSHQTSPKAQPALDHAISRRTERKVLRIVQKLSWQIWSMVKTRKVQGKTRVSQTYSIFVPHLLHLCIPAYSWSLFRISLIGYSSPEIFPSTSHKSTYLYAFLFKLFVSADFLQCGGLRRRQEKIFELGSDSSLLETSFFHFHCH